MKKTGSFNGVIFKSKSVCVNLGLQKFLIHVLAVYLKFMSSLSYERKMLHKNVIIKLNFPNALKFSEDFFLY